MAMDGQICSIFLLLILIIPHRYGKIPPIPKPAFIVDGTEAAPDEFPYIVGVVEKVDKQEYIVASGSILSEWWILTAQHVVFDDIDREIVPKYDNLVEKILSPKLKRYHASKKFCPPKKKGQSWELRDIALLKLSEPIPLGKPPGNFKKIQISKKFKSSSDIWVAGWGYMKSHSAFVQPVSLLKGNLKEFSKPCSPNCEIMINYKNEGEANICHGDSGGPAVIREKGSDDLLIGVISEGDRRCSVEGTFINLTFYLDWIKDTMNHEPDKSLCGKNK